MSILLKSNDNIRNCVPKNFLNILFFELRILRGTRFIELEKRICHLLAARRGKGSKNSEFWSGKNRIWSGKSQGILLVTEDGHPD